MKVGPIEKELPIEPYSPFPPLDMVAVAAASVAFPPPIAGLIAARRADTIRPVYQIDIFCFR
jgi:hypothetical protein